MSEDSTISATLPIIDLSRLTGGHHAVNRNAVEDLRAACQRHGFFILVGHGVPVTLMDRVLNQSAGLFALSGENKRKIAATTPFGRGYSRMGGHDLSGAAHEPVKEEFYLGLGEDTPWPAGLPDFRDTMLEYVDAVHGLAEKLMGALALSLSLPEDHFAGFCDQPIASLRLVRYPPEGAEAGVHTDFGAVTLLLQDPVGGLQVFDRLTGGWIEATPKPGSFVVNLGDLIERWTNKMYRSTLHRVVHRPGSARYSAPFFFTGAAGYPVTCLPTCLLPGEEPAYPPTTPERHLAERRAQQGF